MQKKPFKDSLNEFKRIISSIKDISIVKHLNFKKLNLKICNLNRHWKKQKRKVLIINKMTKMQSYKKRSKLYNSQTNQF